MAEWLKAAVLKTVERLRVPGVRIPLSPPLPRKSEIIMALWLGLAQAVHPKFFRRALAQSSFYLYRPTV